MNLTRRRKQAILGAAAALVLSGLVAFALPGTGDRGGAPVAAAPGGPSAGSEDPGPTGTPSGSVSVSAASRSGAAPTTALPTAIATRPGGTNATTPRRPATSSSGPAAGDLSAPHLKEIAMELVSSAENSSLDWRAQYKYIQDINDGRGYTGGIIGFCSGTGDMLQLVQHYTALKPGNVLAKYVPALQKLDGSSAHTGLDPSFTGDWTAAAADPLFQQAQDDERDRVYFDPAVGQAKADGLHALGQFMYYDALVMHGPGTDALSFGGIRAAALRAAKPPSQGGDETAYLDAFLNAHKAAMKADPSHQDTSRVDTEQRPFLQAGNLNLKPPLSWSTYGDHYTIAS